MLLCIVAKFREIKRKGQDDTPTASWAWPPSHKIDSYAGGGGKESRGSVLWYIGGGNDCGRVEDENEESIDCAKLCRAYKLGAVPYSANSPLGSDG